MIEPVYNKIGDTYDVTRKADTFITAQLKKYLSPQSNARYIDIACGSGNYTQALFREGLVIDGLDISETMLAKARLKSPEITWHHTDARKLPLPENSYHGATCIFATHHIKDTQASYKEIYRIIDKGYFVILTVTQTQMQNYWLKHYFPRLIDQGSAMMQDFHEMEADLLQAGFCNARKEPYFVTEGVEDLFFYSGKYRPDIYLNQAVRDGISYFQLAEDELEIQRGLLQLEKDIHSGQIKQIIRDYENKEGDCLFVIAEKA